MIEIKTATKVAPALSRDTLAGAMGCVLPAYTRDTVRNINLGKQAGLPGASEPPRRAAAPSRQPVPASRPKPYDAPAVPRPSEPVRSATPANPPAPRPLPVPELLRPVQRGQKTPLGIHQGQPVRLKVGFGWNVKDGRCDVDASAFLVTNTGKVPSDDWFVFYGQPESPDGSVRFGEDGRADRQVIALDLRRLDPAIERVVFVMTINEALENGLNFGMIRDAWLRVLDDGGHELVSYRPADFFENITSMTLGELYLRNGEWRFNPVGNGVNTDLAGQCAVYGVQITD